MERQHQCASAPAWARSRGPCHPAAPTHERGGQKAKPSLRTLNIIIALGTMGAFWGSVAAIVLTHGALGSMVEGLPCGLFCGLFVSIPCVVLLRRKNLAAAIVLQFLLVTPAVVLISLALRRIPNFLLWAGAPVAVSLVVAVLEYLLLSDQPEWTEAHICPICGYDLRASIAFGRCPECGYALDHSSGQG